LNVLPLETKEALPLNKAQEVFVDLEAPEFFAAPKETRRELDQLVPRKVMGGVVGEGGEGGRRDHFSAGWGKGR
jgi:hypothetical protein